MSDIVSPTVRSRMMSGIRGKNTLPEMLIRKILFAAGYRFRLHGKDLPGAPDVVLPCRKVAIFVHGCFWHRHAHCKYAKLPASRPEFWKAKLDGNVERDQRAIEALISNGWRVLTVWECSTRSVEALHMLRKSLAEWIQGCDAYGEIAGPMADGPK